MPLGHFERLQRGIFATLRTLFIIGILSQWKQTKTRLKESWYGLEKHKIYLAKKESDGIEFPAKMVKALGGEEKVRNLPIAKIGAITAPIMKGITEDGLPFLLFCFIKPIQREHEYKLTVELLLRNVDSWENAHPNELNLRAQDLQIRDGSLEETHMLDRIERLVKGQAVGMLERYSIIRVKPDDKDDFRPDDAYLIGEELEEYMELDTLFYERKVEEGTTDLFLWDPGKAKDENLQSLRDTFPKITVKEIFTK